MRKDGYYWIRSSRFSDPDNTWAIARWMGGHFECDDRTLSEEEVLEIDEREVVRQVTRFKADIINPEYLMIMHDLSLKEATDLMAFSLSKTIKYRECYGDGSIIFPMWKEYKQSKA